ncbi:MAG: cbb3-type cytochrome c oxidase subunit I [Nitrospirae bacterium]|nr:cbb3-type cytochrome c oxidase subunit I [Nitrospirota bacterium]
MIEPTFPKSGGVAKLARGWLLLAIAALVVAGLLAVLLVLSRTPFIQGVFPLIDLFHVALVIHVDLSVMIWFIAMAGVFWTLVSSEKMIKPGFIALGMASLGTAIMALSPLMGANNPLMNNYVPVLNDWIFIWGLEVLFAGFTLLLLRSLCTIPLSGLFNGEDGALRFGMFAAALVALLSMVLFVWTYASIPQNIKGLRYYEILFWGGGHLLQAMHSMLMIVAWVVLARAGGVKYHFEPVVIVLVFAIALIAALCATAIQVVYPVDSPWYRYLFTVFMEYAIGPSVVIAAFVLVKGMFFPRGKDAGDHGQSTSHLRAALISSMALFGAGGVIGFLISGVNVTIPAHYHGVIVGVTLAYMGIVYYLLPRLGYGEPKKRLATVQLYLYGSGQLLHIIGLALAGEMGVQRKVAGVAQGLDSMKKIVSMGLMGFGGMVAVVGGLLFLIVAIMAMRRP